MGQKIKDFIMILADEKRKIRKKRQWNVNKKKMDFFEFPGILSSDFTGAGSSVLAICCAAKDAW